MNLEFQEYIDYKPTNFRDCIQSALFAHSSENVKQELMHVFGFKEHTIGLNRHKEFTLRDNKYRRWHTGKDIHFIMHGKLFAPVVSAHVRFAKLRCDKFVDDGLYGEELSISVDGRALSVEEHFDFVLKDGFSSVSDFILYHFKGTGKVEILHKTLIGWTELKY